MNKLCLAFALICVTCVSAAQSSNAKDPIKALHAACPGLAQFADDVTIDPSPARGPASLTEARKGWKQVYAVKVRVKDRPSERVVLMYAMGHTCHFDVEAEKLGMVAVTKRPCVAICRNLKINQLDEKAFVTYLGADGSMDYVR